MSTPDQKSVSSTFYRGPLAWMAQNSVAANLIMAMFLIGGFLMIPRIKQEVFPEITLDTVSVNVVYPGASPAEVEQGTILAIEEAIRGIDGIKEVTSSANEGSGAVTAELLLGADRQQSFNDIKAAVDRITSFPAEIEQPRVSLVSPRREVISLVIHGDTDEHTLKKLGERVRDDLLADPDITVVELSGLRAPEISVEVPQESLRRYNLTLEQVAAAIRRASIELPGGGIKTEAGEILLRTNERRVTADGFADIVVLSQPDGTEVTVGDLGVVLDTFEEVDRATFFDGSPAVQVVTFRVGDQTPIEISDTVRQYAAEHAHILPAGVEFAIWDDNSEIYRDRINLLLKNAAMGLVLVLMILGIFLELRLAFWVTLGIPISFLGAILFMPAIDVSLNMISLFAFILTLGIVVDDAIVVGEAVYKHRQDGMRPLRAAIAGVREVAQPVTFSVLTTVIAFSPLLFVPGVTGKFFKVIPLIVIPILLISLVESLVILPAHLAHNKPPSQKGFLGSINRAQQAFSDVIDRGIERLYVPCAAFALRWRYVTISMALSMLVLTGGLIAGGIVKFTFFPKIEGDVVTANVELPFGTSVEETEEALGRINAGMDEVFAANGGRDVIGRGVLTLVGRQAQGGGPNPGVATEGSHVGSVRVFLVGAGERGVTTAQFTKQWREAVSEIAGVESLTFQYNIGPGATAPIDVELSHPDMNVLRDASARLATRLEKYSGVSDINDGFMEGKEQLDFTLKPEARAMGLTETELARQVRNAFFGAEALRQQRGRDELRVYVRRPLSERQSEYNIEDLLLRTPNGEIPLRDAAEIDRGRSYTSINRQDGRRLVHVTADVDTKVITANEVVRDLEAQVLPQLIAETPGLRYAMGGDQRDRAESFGALGTGFLLAMLAMFGLMAIAFRSYVQPIIIMCAIPFGIVGAIMGHLLMGFSLSIISMMGIVALSGVVVNDSLVLVDAVNTYRREGMATMEAVVAGGRRRFRPILLTTLTTFFGLVPMILETSVQARFLIPMALSLGFGILFVTFIALILVPTLYIIIEDVKGLVVWSRAYWFGETITSDEPLHELGEIRGGADGTVHGETSAAAE